MRNKIPSLRYLWSGVGVLVVVWCVITVFIYIFWTPIEIRIILIPVIGWVVGAGILIATGVFVVFRDMWIRNRRPKHSKPVKHPEEEPEQPEQSKKEEEQSKKEEEQSKKEEEQSKKEEEQSNLEVVDSDK